MEPLATHSGFSLKPLNNNYLPGLAVLFILFQFSSSLLKYAFKLDSTIGPCVVILI